MSPTVPPANTTPLPTVFWPFHPGRPSPGGGRRRGGGGGEELAAETPPCFFSPVLVAARALRAAPRSLRAPFYTDEAVFEADMAHVLRHCWLLAGHSSRAPSSGDHFTYTVGHDSIIITRTDDGALHAMHNVCRHRGMQLVDIEELGNSACDATVRHAPLLRCPYHAWTCEGHTCLFPPPR
eukprot:COSAG04_NODE_1600_length_6195_cov_14.714567_8_plen_181_part_00